MNEKGHLSNCADVILAEPSFMAVPYLSSRKKALLAGWQCKTFRDHKKIQIALARLGELYLPLPPEDKGFVGPIH
jgi:hypothetical protein